MLIAVWDGAGGDQVPGRVGAHLYVWVHTRGCMLVHVGACSWEMACTSCCASAGTRFWSGSMLQWVTGGLV